MNLSKVAAFYEFGENKHDFYRCHKCGAIFTQEYERLRLNDMSLEGDDCPMFIHCTSLRYAPTRPRLWQWLYPSILKYAVKVFLARAVAPWAEKRKNVWLFDTALTLAGNRLTV